MAAENKYDDEVTIIGGSEWKPEPANGQDASGEIHNGENRVDKTQGGTSTLNQTNVSVWKTAALLSVSVLILLSLLLLCKHLYFRSQFPKSRPDREIIENLAGCNGYESETDLTAGVEFSESVSMGVTLKKYALTGLKAHFADTVPDCSDSSIYLVTRSADYRIRNDRRAIIGDFIQDGEILSKSDWRAGFMAVADGNAQIGISRSGKVRNFILKQNGSFFRQLAIVSAGTRCDRQFILKGKVTRCAYARDENGRLYFIETAYPETLYGFADALVEDGFIDAIYVTGGTQPDLFYREEDGKAHGWYVDDKPHKLVVWTGR